MNEINEGFVAHLQKIEEYERRQQLKAQPKILRSEARAQRRRKMKQMETLMKMANGATRPDYQYNGLKHNKCFVSIVKPHRGLFSTYEPLSNFEARYNATAKIIQEQEEEVKKSKSPPRKEVNPGYRFDPSKL